MLLVQLQICYYAELLDEIVPCISAQVRHAVTLMALQHFYYNPSLVTHWPSHSAPSMGSRPIQPVPPNM